MNLANKYKLLDKRKQHNKSYSLQSSFYQLSKISFPEYSLMDPDDETSITEKYYVSIITHLNKEISNLYKIYCKKVKKYIGRRTEKN